jgi:hypothetical protein
MKEDTSVGELAGGMEGAGLLCGNKELFSDLCTPVSSTSQRAASTLTHRENDDPSPHPGEPVDSLLTRGTTEAR